MELFGIGENSEHARITAGIRAPQDLFLGLAVSHKLPEEVLASFDTDSAGPNSFQALRL